MTSDDSGRDDIRARIVEYAELHPDAGVIEALGEMGLAPGEWRDTVAVALGAEDPSSALADSDLDVDHSHTGDKADTTEAEGEESDVIRVEPAESPADIVADDAGRTGPGSAQEQSSADSGTNGVLVNDNTGVSEENAGESAERTESSASNPTPDAGKVGSNTPEMGEYGDIDFSDIVTGVYPPTLLETEQWMGRKDKLPFAPWGDRNAALECSHTTCPDHDDQTVEAVVEDCPDCQAHRDGTTTVECDHDARYKWGHDGHYVDGERVAMAEDDPRLDGRVFIQREEDQFAFVDGDDVRCPETGDVHPEFLEILDDLGLTYADISASGAGVHAYYIGDLPDGEGQAVFDLDDEPWGENEDAPTVEIYANKHVCVATGDHVAGTPEDVVEWDAAALEGILDEHIDEEERPEVDHDTDRELPDLDDYDVDATTADETAADVRDIRHAVDQLRPSDLPLRTRQVGSDSTGWEQWDPSTYRSSSGNDSLHKPPREPVFHDHKMGESFGVLSLFAAEEGIISKPWHRLAGGDWWDAVDAARESGAPIPQYEGDSTTHTPVLPDTEDLDTAVSGWDWRHTAREGDLSISDARRRTTDAIADAYESGDRVLVEALPTMGKSYGSIKAAAETGEQITVVTGRGEKEQYQQLKQWCEEFGLSYKTLPSFTRDCPTAAGQHDDEWHETVMDWYRRGATPQAIHNAAEYVLDRPLPCQVSERGEHIDCSYRHAWDFDADDYDVLIGHYTHAHTDQATSGRVVVFDEFPDSAYETQLGGQQLQSAVSYWLSTDGAGEIPFDDYTDLVENRHDEQRRSDALAQFVGDDGPTVGTDEGLVFDDSGAHAAAPLAVFALLAGEDLGNGFEAADLEDAGTAAFNREHGSVSIIDPPALHYASGIVALDGTPTKQMWELSLGTRLNHRPVLQENERADYVQDALNLNLVRTTDAVKPYNNSDHVTVGQDAALLEGIADTHDQRPAVITSATAEGEYDSAGILDLVDETKHYGNVLGSNEFKQTRLGAVIGSNHYGDHFIKKWGAYAGRTVERNDGRGTELSYGEFGDRVLTHMREHDTLQAAMRFGRDGNGAVVYVHTDTLPEWVPLAGEGRVATTWSDGMRDVLRALEDLTSATTADIVDHPDVSIGRRQVLKHLEALREQGVLSREQDEDDGRRVLWQDDGIHRVNDHGDVDFDTVELDDLDEDEVAELARMYIYTWEFRNFTSGNGDSPASAAGGGGPRGVAGVNGRGDPPDDAD